MPSEQWKHYLQAGMEITEVPRKRAEKIVRDLVKAGEVQAHEAGQRVDELLERSRQSAETFGEKVRVEVQRQMEALGLVQPVTKTMKKAAGTAKKASKATKPTAKKTAQKTATTAKKAAGKP